MDNRRGQVDAGQPPPATTASDPPAFSPPQSVRPAVDGHVASQARLVRATGWTILVVTTLAAGVEAAYGIIEPTGRALFVLSGATALVSLAMVPALWLLQRARLGPAVFVICLAIFWVQCVYLSLVPQASLPLTIAAFVVILLAFPYLSGGRLLALVIAEGLVAGAAAVWGTLAKPSFVMPGQAIQIVVVATGLGAVAVGLVLLWHFGNSMKRSIWQLEAANKQLRGLDALKTRFIVAAAQELNTPLTPVWLHWKMLTNDRSREADAAQEKSLQVIERNLERLSLLVRDILHATRLQARTETLRFETFPMAAPLREATQDVATTAQSQGIKVALHVDGDPIAIGDREKVRQVIAHLLSNALRFTPGGGSITVRATQEREQVLVRVRDTGLGFRPEQVGNLFQPFTHLHEEGLRKTSGMGLYTSRVLVESMSGTMWASSPGLGQGAEFAFALPAA